MDPRTEYINEAADITEPDSILRTFSIRRASIPTPGVMIGMRNIIKAAEENLAVIDYHEFGEKWLPLFNYTSHESIDQIPLTDWTEQVALSPFKEVRLMNWVNGEYVEIARIPPMFGMVDDIFKDGIIDVPLNKVAVDSRSFSLRGQLDTGEEYIQRGFLDNLNDHVLTVPEHFLRMNEIFKLYGKTREIPDWIKEKIEASKPKEETTPEASSSIQAQQSVVSGMIEDEEV